MKWIDIRNALNKVISEKLKVNPYILECYNFDISNKNEYIPQITFNVKTVYGELEMEV